jgi:hypothetical protein
MTDQPGQARTLPGHLARTSRTNRTSNSARTNRTKKPLLRGAFVRDGLSGFSDCPGDVRMPTVLRSIADIMASIVLRCRS